MVQESTTGDTSTGEYPFLPPAIALPKGEGVIRGMGEQFAANPVTGTGALSVPMATSLERACSGPQLSLAYDSGVGSKPLPPKGGSLRQQVLLPH